MRKRSWLTPELREILDAGRLDDLRELIGDLHPNDAAELLTGLDNDEVVRVMAILPVELERDMFEYFDPEQQESIVLGSGREQVRELLEALPSDERAEFLDRLDERVRNQLVGLLPAEDRAEIMRRESFEDDQVGAILSTEFCVLRKEFRAVDAIAELRRQEPNRETIYYSYVIDEDDRLIGFVSLRDLIAARDDETVESLMKTDVVSVRAEADQEDAAKVINEYDLLAVPVVDSEHRVVGIVTYDDALDILEEEDTEDAELMAGVTGETEAEGYLEESVFSQIRRRGPSVWIFAVFYLVTASVIDNLSDELPRTLATFMPLVMATGGTVGVQAGTLVIRALTLGGLEPRAIPTVFWKEVRISMGLASILSAIIFVEGMWIGDANSASQLTHMCIAMALAMVLTVAATSLFGATIPLIARRVGIDPAMVSAPAITAVGDLSGATIYLLVFQLAM